MISPAYLKHNDVHFMGHITWCKVYLALITPVFYKIDSDCEAIMGIHTKEQSPRSQQQEEDHLQWWITFGFWDRLYWHVQDE